MSSSSTNFLLYIEIRQFQYKHNFRLFSTVQLKKSSFNKEQHGRVNTKEEESSNTKDFMPL